MLIGRMIAPVRTLGPGKRVCLWVQGCGRRCKGCMSPELQEITGTQWPVEFVAQLLLDAAKRADCSGLTVSGGEPLGQTEELLKLLALVRPYFRDILLYTGYPLAHIDPEVRCKLGALVDVLIDGPYIEERNLPDCTLRGSSNQVIHYIKPHARQRYEPYLAAGRTVETFSHEGTVIHVGILNRGE